MIDIAADVAIIGSGFGGSLTALLLSRIGLKPVLIERGTHPRVVLGESSTPVADLILQSLAQRYDLPRLAPLAKFGPWRRAYPSMPVGLKRGFSYFRHTAGQPFAPRADHRNELLFAASDSDETSDTHWYRPDFDQFLVREAQAAGIPFLDRTSIGGISGEGPWQLACEREGEAISIRADFLVDASGEGQVLARHLSLKTDPGTMRTNSRALYGHFTGVALWHEQLAERGGAVADHPFPCDDAALHHLIDGGWMFVLRFNNDVTSAGFLLDCRAHPLDAASPPEDEWQALLERYPSIGEQFRNAKLTDLCGPLRRTRRLQRRARPTVGPAWAMLPLTAYSLDALHSSGNAHTLTGIERLVRILECSRGVEDRFAALRASDRVLRQEIDLIDEIVAGCYLAFADFDLLASFAMFYFAGATVSETTRRRGRDRPEHAFLLAHDDRFRGALHEASAALHHVLRDGPPTPAAAAEFGRLVARLIEPYNIAGLCDPARRNMYPFIEIDA
jgi:tetracycline 7-halogenase / FADH2 O2-dependent halogenase